MSSQNKSYKDRLGHLEKLNRNQFREIERLRLDMATSKEKALGEIKYRDLYIDKLMNRGLIDRILNKK